MSAPIDLADIRFARRVERLHRLGPRALHAMLAELGAQYLLREPVEAAVRRYVERLTPAMIDAASAAWWPKFACHAAALGDDRPPPDEIS